MEFLHTNFGGEACCVECKQRHCCAQLTDEDPIPAVVRPLYRYIPLPVLVQGAGVGAGLGGGGGGSWQGGYRWVVKFLAQKD